MKKGRKKMNSDTATRSYVKAESETGKLSRAVRERHGWTQQTLAERLGVSISTIGRWEMGGEAQRFLRRALEKLLEEKKVG